MEPNPERARLDEETARTAYWYRWGPYVSDRQWGTVREDYSPGGDAWTSFPFEHARSRTYRWGEDGIFGISDNHQHLCFAPAFWNGEDAILKERFYGLSGPQGNHGEDVKECYYFQDNTPTHSYMRALYKYPHAAFPYDDLRRTNAARSRSEPEYELVDTGVFAHGYTDATVEYAKASTTDILIRITVVNRGSASAPLHVVPQLWFRNEWSWAPGGAHGAISAEPAMPGTYVARRGRAEPSWLHAEGDARALHTENETNLEALYGAPNPQPYVKDAIDRAIVRGEADACNPAGTGSKLGLHYAFELAPGETRVLRLRLAGAPIANAFGAEFDATFAARIEEADRFYAELNPYDVGEDARAVQRAAFAGMLWSKQFYFYVIRDWLRGDPLQPPPPPERRDGRNHNWIHLYNDDVVSMPDTWEYPWYAAWDLAFHTVVLALVDPTFAKRQLIMLTREWYMSPSGQIPAYEWNFGDVNPPVQAWAAYRIFQIERKLYGTSDHTFLERVFQKLLMNFTWWVNREDPDGENVFGGGFLGLDNISIFDRSSALPTGGRILQSDATSWMAIYALDMLAIALELARHDAAYEDIATKFFEHFLYIASAINDDARDGLWDEPDGFYYDRLVLPDGSHHPLRVRSMVGLFPLLAVQTISQETLEALPDFRRRLEWFVANRPELSRNVASLESEGVAARKLLAVLDGERLHRVLRVMLDEAEFLSGHGVRSLSRYHREHPLVVRIAETEFRVDYDPAESRSPLFGGNSNWRGPVWMPINYLIVEALQNFHFFYGDAYRVEYPTGSGELRTLWEIATDLSRRLVSLFTRDVDGRRPCNGANALLQTDPHFRDLYLFHEYFDGDDGAGLGAAHQTGWTGLVAKLVQQVGEYEIPGKSPLDTREASDPPETAAAASSA